MKKVLFKENGKYYLIVDIILYNLVCILGLTILLTKGLEFINALQYFYIIFYIIAMVSLIAYFINRRNDDYELLFYSLINIYVGSYSLVYASFKETWFILGCSMMIYTIANILNKGLHIKKMDSNYNSSVVSKLSILVLITMLSVFTSINLYSKNGVESTIIGYYFLAFGLFSLIEPYLNVILRNEKLSKYLLKDCSKTNEVKKIKEVPKRQVIKPVKKSTNKK